MSATPEWRKRIEQLKERCKTVETKIVTAESKHAQADDETGVETK